VIRIGPYTSPRRSVGYLKFITVESTLRNSGWLEWSYFGNLRTSGTIIHFADSTYVIGVVLARTAYLHIEFALHGGLLALREFLGSAVAGSGPGFQIVEEILFDLRRREGTLSSRLRRMGGAEKASYLSRDLGVLRDVAVGTSSSV